MQGHKQNWRQITIEIWNRKIALTDRVNKAVSSYDVQFSCKNLGEMGSE